MVPGHRGDEVRWGWSWALVVLQTPISLRSTAQEWGPPDQEPPPWLLFKPRQTHTHIHTFMLTAHGVDRRF